MTPTEIAESLHSLARANEILTTFHRIRRQDVESGKSPTIKESLATMASGGRG
ncbi:MAG: hypothetical protein ACREKS_00755 [Candidatus Rokuibacteriota bacterium]